MRFTDLANSGPLGGVSPNKRYTLLCISSTHLVWEVSRVWRLNWHLRWLCPVQDEFNVGSLSLSFGKKCNGCDFLTCVSVLNFTLDFRYWNRIRNCSRMYLGTRGFNEKHLTTISNNQRIISHLLKLESLSWSWRRFILVRYLIIHVKFLWGQNESQLINFRFDRALRQICHVELFLLNTIALVLTWQNNVQPPDLPQCSFRLLGRAWSSGRNEKSSEGHFLRHQYCFREVRNLECGEDVCCITAKLFPGHFLVTLARIP